MITNKMVYPGVINTIHNLSLPVYYVAIITCVIVYYSNDSTDL